MFCCKCHLSIEVKNFHHFECPVMNLLKSLQLTSTMRMALTTFIVALSLFDGSPVELEKFLEEFPVSRTIFDIKYNERKQQLLAILSLVCDENIEIKDNVLEDIFCCLSSSDREIIWSANKNFIKCFVKRQTQVASLNYHEIYNWPLKREDVIRDGSGISSLAYKRRVVPTGNGSYPFCSLLNHSCSPNVSRVFVAAKIVLIVIYPINKGDQIFDNYGYSFTNVPKNHRQSKLLKQYKFKCRCRACENDWKLLPSLKIYDTAILNRAKKECREICRSIKQQKKLLQKYNDLCQIIGRMSSFPCLEMCSMMESTAACLELFLKPAIQFT